jgi:hypothetical protein
MDHSLSFESYRILNLLLGTFYYLVHKNLPLGLILSQIYLGRTLQPYFFESILILSSHLNWSTSEIITLYIRFGHETRRKRRL